MCTNAVECGGVAWQSRSNVCSMYNINDVIISTYFANYRYAQEAGSTWYSKRCAHDVSHSDQTCDVYYTPPEYGRKFIHHTRWQVTRTGSKPTPRECRQLCTLHASCRSVTIQLYTRNCYLHSTTIRDLGFNSLYILDLGYDYITYDRYCKNRTSYYPTGSCPRTDRYSSNGNCYWTNVTRVNFTVAESTCRSYGGHLVSIHSAAEHQYVAEMIGTYTNARGVHWTGLTDVSGGECGTNRVCANWRYTDGTTYRYMEKWANDKPDANGDCVVTGYRGSADMGSRWDDQPCQTHHAFICKKGIDFCDWNNCHREASCQNMERSFTCTCKPGYSEDGVHDCTNIDECHDDVHKHNCHNDATCTDDVTGSFNCNCKAGYSGDGVHECTNIDECHDDVHRHNNCHHNSTCTDSLGSFACTCNVGYAGEGLACSDRDECKDNLTAAAAVCHAFAKCTNSAGSYTCHCQSGYAGDGLHCTKTKGPNTPVTAIIVSVVSAILLITAVCIAVFCWRRKTKKPESSSHVSPHSTSGEVTSISYDCLCHHQKEKVIRVYSLHYPNG